MNNPVISVLILAWNDEKYIEKCLDSVLSQTFTNFEVIIVDDGSTDFSGKICDEYENKNARIQVFHKRNEGISASRNFLLKKAKGKYIKFVDSDDWIESKTLEIMYNAAVESPAELVQCNLVLVEKERNTKINIFRSAREDFFRRAIGDQYATVALSLISKELIERINLTFPRDINNGEDYFFTCTCLLHTKNACCVNHYLYYYNRLNQLSTMANQDEKRILEQIIASKLVEKELKRSGYINKYKKEILVRKYNSKRPLLKINPLKFFPIFPESNVLYLYYIGNLTKGVLKRKL